jgi:hypothetical protein
MFSVLMLISLVNFVLGLLLQLASCFLWSIRFIKEETDDILFVLSSCNLWQLSCVFTARENLINVIDHMIKMPSVFY